MEVYHVENPAVRAAVALEQLLVQHAASPTLLMVAGGSWLAVLDLITLTSPGSQVTLCVLDERFSTDPTVNNFVQLRAGTFYQRVTPLGVQSIATVVSEADTLPGFTQRFESNLQTWHRDNADGVVIAAIGWGTDGHIAGIFPNTIALAAANEEWLCGYEASMIEYTKRITVTPYFLTNIVDYAVGYGVGTEKKSLILQLEANALPPDTPLCLLKQMKSVSVFTGS